MARNNKDAVVIVLDVGENTKQMSGRSGKTFFERAKDCVYRIVLRKIFSRPGDEIGIILFGSETTSNDLNNSLQGYENIEELGSLEVPSWNMLKKVVEIKQCEGIGDWMDASIVAVNYMRNEIMAKKFQNLRIILLTNFKAEGNDADIDVISKNFNDFGIELIGVSDTVEYSSAQLDSCQFNTHLNKEQTQSKSEEVFVKLTKLTERATLCHIDFVESQLLQYQKKATRSVPWNTTLSIGTELQISISGYVHIQEEKFFPTFKTTCKDPDTLTKYTTEYVKSNENVEKPQVEDVMKAYMYGSKLIACEDDPGFEYECGKKGLACIGFTDKKYVLPEYLVGKGNHIVVPQKGAEKSKQIFTALVHAMNNKKLVMFARKIYRDKAKSTLVVLLPQIDEDSLCLVMIEMAFYDDMKFLNFPRLNSKKTKPSDAQIKAMEKLISTMDLTNAIDNDSGITEAFTFDTPNPINQHMCHAIAYRALHPNEPLPSFDEKLMETIDIPAKIKKESAEAIKEVEELFPLEIIKHRVKKPFGQKSATSNDNNDKDVDMDAETEAAHERNIVAIGTVTPVEDFGYLLNKGTVRFAALCEQIQSIIYEFIFKATTDFSEKIKETVMGYREYAKIHGPFTYNKWMAELKNLMVKRNKIDEWNNLIVKEGFGLISINESPMSEITIEDQLEFYETNLKDVPMTSVIADNDDNELDQLLSM